MCMYVLHLAMAAPMSFSQDDMPRCRIHMAQRLMADQVFVDGSRPCLTSPAASRAPSPQPDLSRRPASWCADATPSTQSSGSASTSVVIDSALPDCEALLSPAHREVLSDNSNLRDCDATMCPSSKEQLASNPGPPRLLVQSAHIQPPVDTSSQIQDPPERGPHSPPDPGRYDQHYGTLNLGPHSPGGTWDSDPPSPAQSASPYDSDHTSASGFF